jgi:hypothetical protein
MERERREAQLYLNVNSSLLSKTGPCSVVRLIQELPHLKSIPQLISGANPSSKNTKTNVG